MGQRTVATVPLADALTVLDMPIFIARMLIYFIVNGVNAMCACGTEEC
ncbi:uncharacterized protein VTP21DRAFT_6681 [Calcarisporiella thermophila]